MNTMIFLFLSCMHYSLLWWGNIIPYLLLLKCSMSKSKMFMWAYFEQLLIRIWLDNYIWRKTTSALTHFPHSNFHCLLKNPFTWHHRVLSFLWVELIQFQAFFAPTNRQDKQFLIMLSLSCQKWSKLFFAHFFIFGCAHRRKKFLNIFFVFWKRVTEILKKMLKNCDSIIQRNRVTCSNLIN